MTCIIGVANDGKVYIGGDRSGVDGWQKLNNAQPKVFKVGKDMLFGWTGSARCMQIVQHEYTPTPNVTSRSDYGYLCATVAEELRNLFTARGIVGKNDDHEDIFDGAFLIGYHGNLYRLSNNFQVNHLKRGYDGIGSGSPFALGALVAGNYKDDPIVSMISALKAAEVLCVDVSSPFDVEVI